MKQKIRTVSYVHIGDRLVCTDDLNPLQKDYIGTVLKTTYLNELFAGRAVFEPVEQLPSRENVFSEYLE